MSDEQEKGFKVTDRRINVEDEEQAPASDTPPAEPEEEAGEAEEAQDAGTASAGEEPAAGGDDPAPEGEQPGDTLDDAEASQDVPMTFSTLLISLGTSALAHLGEVPDPVLGQQKADLRMARQTIDILGVLEEKTQGNLSQEEEQLLRNLLYDLRMRYVQAGKTSGS